MTEAAPAAPADAGQANGQGTDNAQSGNWYDGHGFKDEDIGYVQNKAWKNPLEVVNAYKNLEKFHGVPADQLIKLPKDLSDEKAMGEIYSRLGRPEKPEAYEFKAPEGVRLDDDRMNWAKGVSHKLGLSKAQHASLVQATLEYEGGVISESEKKFKQISEEQLVGLKKEWGNAFAEREALGKRAVRAFLPGDQEHKAALMNAIEGAIGTAPMLKLFANIGEKMGEDKIHEGDGDRPFGYTPQQAQADKANLMAELSRPENKSRLDEYNNGKGKDYEEMQRLLRIISGAA